MLNQGAKMEFEDLSNKLKIELLQICSQDTYNLKPKSLYNNIKNSTGSYETLAKIFDVPLWVVQKIKQHK